jgi:membrane protein
LIYKFMPNTKVGWRHVWPGAVLSSVLFEVARSLFVLYVARFSTYELVYGSVASIIVFMVWMYISAFILILGAEFVSEHARLARHPVASHPEPPAG